ncbi:MAG: stage V sporulation protein AB [Bacteroidales bacterium]|nr:stage V sporulation protein AB [Anaerotignum sp.]MCI5680034.1 stage V sporulation protein AB [Bacteroidales bacterium]MDY3926662.1 stage V sporulation protein AB [Anaerotignum sp.]
MAKSLFLIFCGLSSGCLVAAGTFAFIAAIGIVPRMAKRTKTQRYIRVYEDAIVLGGIFGTTAMFMEYRFPEIPFLLGVYGFCAGIFVGVLAMALTEVLNVVPIMLRRARLTKGLQWLVLAFALGKVFGSLAYFLIDGFYVL